MNKSRLVNVSVLVVVALAIVALAAGLLTLAQPARADDPGQGYQCKVYVEQGCAKQVVASGGEIEVRSGGTVDFQAGSTFSSGNFTANGNLVVTGTSDLQGNVSDSLGTFTVNDDLTVAQTTTVSAGGIDVTGNSSINGTLNMNNKAVSNIGAAGTDFGSDGSLTTAQTITVSAGGVQVTGNSSVNGTLDMNNKAISNIGAAGTDFGADGSLTTAQTLTVSAGGIGVTAGNVTLSSGDLSISGASDLQGDVSDSGGDFTVADNAVITGTCDIRDRLANSTGNLTVGDDLDVTGALDVQGGGITLQNDETIVNSLNGTITTTVDAAGRFAVSAGNLVVGVGDPSLTLNGEDAYVSGSLEADGLSRLDGGVSMAGDLSIANGLLLPMFDDTTANNGDTITPTTVSGYILDSSGDVTITLGVCTQDGQTFTLVGDDAHTITINTTNLRTTDGNALTLGQYDVIVLLCQDDEWLHISKSANQ